MSEEGLYLGRYEIGRRLGRGGMGEVWLAYDCELELNVALKFVKKSLGEREAEILKRETKQARQFSHRHILPVYDFHFRKGERAAISMEYAPGGSLADLVSRERPVLEVSEITGWMLQVCDALAYVHELGLVHRDVKQSNLMLGEGNELKLADFGLSSKWTPSLDSDTRAAIGNRLTRHFASPQLIQNPYQSHHSNDIYALGVTIFVLLTGTFPFRDPERDRWRWNPSSFLSMNDRRRRKGWGKEPVPDSWEYAVSRCLAEDPADRPANMWELAGMLEPGAIPSVGFRLPTTGEMEGRHLPGVSRQPGQEDKKPRSNSLVLVVLLAAALGLLAGVLWGAFAIFEAR